MTSYYQNIIPDKAAIIAIPFIIAFVCMPLLVVGAALPAEVVSEAPAEDASVVVSGVGAVETKVDVVKDSLESLTAVEETLKGTVKETAEEVVVSLIPQTFSTSKVNSMFLASHSSVCLWIESNT
jgi:hypothetical protein